MTGFEIDARCEAACPRKGGQGLTLSRKSLPKVRWEGPAATPFPPPEAGLSIYTSWGPTETDEAEVSVYVTPSFPNSIGIRMRSETPSLRQTMQ